MTRLGKASAIARHVATRRLQEGLIRAHRVPRYAYRHYFLEDEGLHSRIHLQNFYSTMWPNIGEPVAARVELFDATGHSLGALERRIAPFGGLFLEVGDALAELGARVPEGTVLVDAEPPRGALAELTSFPLEDKTELLLGTPFWMAYYDDDENYMYVHAISPEMGEYHVVPKPIGRFLIQGGARTGGRWRAGRLLDVAGLADLQVVVVNHANGRRVTELGLYDADDGSAVWKTHLDLSAHEVGRVRVDHAALDAFRLRKPEGRFRAGLDPLPTSNGKPYLLMRYGDGPLSLHHG